MGSFCMKTLCMGFWASVMDNMQFSNGTVISLPFENQHYNLSKLSWQLPQIVLTILKISLKGWLAGENRISSKVILEVPRHGRSGQRFIVWIKEYLKTLASCVYFSFLKFYQKFNELEGKFWFQQFKVGLIWYVYVAPFLESLTSE